MVLTEMNLGCMRALVGTFDFVAVAVEAVVEVAAEAEDVGVAVGAEQVGLVVASKAAVAVEAQGHSVVHSYAEARTVEAVVAAGSAAEKARVEAARVKEHSSGQACSGTSVVEGKLRGSPGSKMLLGP